MLRLKQLRKEKNLSQKKFAELFGVAQNTVSNWENENRSIDATTIQKLAKFFDVSSDYLLGILDTPTPKTLDEQLDGIEFALFCEVKELTEEQKRDILNYAKFVKSRDQKS